MKLYNFLAQLPHFPIKQIFVFSTDLHMYFLKMTAQIGTSITNSARKKIKEWKVVAGFRDVLILKVIILNYLT